MVFVCAFYDTRWHGVHASEQEAKCWFEGVFDEAVNTEIARVRVEWSKYVLGFLIRDRPEANIGQHIDGR